MSGFNTESLEWVTDMKERNELENIMKNEITLTELEFRDLLDLVMCDDTLPVDDKQQSNKNLAITESHLRGYQDWIEAYHMFVTEEDSTDES